jgi:hypothetical protein
MQMTIRVAVMSDLHVEFESSWMGAIQRRAAAGTTRGEDVAAVELRRALAGEQGHPAQGPDLRGCHDGGGVDLVLLAGDVALGTGLVAYAEQVAGYLRCPVAAVAGNHEFYHHVHGDLLRDLAARARGTAVAFLERGRRDFALGGRRVAVLGATLWTDYRLNGNEMRGLADAWGGLNDHRLIAAGWKRPFTPHMALEQHKRAKAWLAEEARRARGEADAVVVLTHHAPIPEANPERYRGGDLSPAFASDLRAEIAAWAPDLWVWGHTHFSMDATLGRTRLLSAQRGYVGVEDGADTFVPAIVEL